MLSQPLTPDQEAEAQSLAAKIRASAEADILALARLLVSKPENEIFGQTEFEVRKLVHGLGAKAFEVHLAEKKTAIRAPASSVPTASKPQSSKAIGRKRPSASSAK